MRPKRDPVCQWTSCKRQTVRCVTGSWFCSKHSEQVLAAIQAKKKRTKKREDLPFGALLDRSAIEGK